MLDSDDRASALLQAAPYKALALRDRAVAPLEAEQLRLPELPRPATRRRITRAPTSTACAASALDPARK